MSATDLVTWLRARLDDDERVARALAGATRFVGGSPDFYGVGGPAADAYWSHFTPASVLAEVDAKRRIIDRLAETLSTASEYFTVESCDEDDAILAETTMRLLALPYADRPGYRDEWRQ